MLVASGLPCSGAAGGTVVSNRQKTGSEYLGHQPSPGGLRGNGSSATSPWPGYRQERLGQDHWAAAGRSETARDVPALEPDCPKRSARLQRAAEGEEGASASRAGRKGGNDADHQYCADTD